MDNKDRFIKITQIVVFVLLVLSIGLNVYLLTKENKYEVVEKVRTEVVRDTIHDTIPDVRYEKVLYTVHDTLKLCDTIPGDTVQVVVEVPITQKEYSDDSTYRVWVSGYRQKLDSICVYRENVYITKEIIKTKKQRFIIGPYVGYGYDFANKRGCPNIGVGIMYNLFGF